MLFKEKIVEYQDVFEIELMSTTKLNAKELKLYVDEVIEKRRSCVEYIERVNDFFCFYQ